MFMLQEADLRFVLRGCDHPAGEPPGAGGASGSDPKGFWRVDREKPPELRHTVLTQVAFHDLQNTIADHGGDHDAGVAAWLAQNDGEGWMLPDELRLADYGLGHDPRADRPQPVASVLGPRFYDWQLEQDPEESWPECELHARNFLGPEGFAELMAQVRGDAGGEQHLLVAEDGDGRKGRSAAQGGLFDDQ